MFHFLNMFSGPFSAERSVESGEWIYIYIYIYGYIYEYISKLFMDLTHLGGKAGHYHSLREM